MAANYILSFTLFAIYLYIERCLKHKKGDVKKFHICAIVVGSLGLIIVNISKIFYFENFFILIFVSSFYEIWKDTR